jgi:hypothetical protein
VSARDKYDPGGKAAVERQERVKRIVQERMQFSCARETIDRACRSPERHVPGTLEHALVVAYTAYLAEVGR